MTDGAISATNARINLYDLLEEVEKLSRRIVITKRGKAKAILLNPDELEGLEETLEILQDKRAIASIKKSMEEIKAGKILPFQQATGESL
jgi:antitoxin YefM